ncbi:paraquat-inducible protein [Aliidongia dinghuensis]|uniref:Paraquat-inducible protein n=1 Tax=Aliidongia dinghuensis TaxID=1867774 RepID=A0A8J2YW99_9PROT|nr:MlaD family protein [Aliidongia dinghuensis]GGF27864.1 paraquat-inducible protein [Aliidongia dinghuensis]
MSEREGTARIRRSHLLALVWLVPIAAFLVVVWVGFQTFAEHGPTVTITFASADGLDAGRTKIRHKAVDIGTVKSVVLTKDMSHVEVTAVLDRQIEDRVTTNARFWVVRPRVSAAGITGLATLVSGAYIEMDPGPADKKGEPADHFAGLEEPPVVDEEDVPGTRFTLHADDLGSLAQGSPLYFRGIKAGEVLGFQLGKQARQTDIFIYVRAPYDKLVRPKSHFYNVSGLSISAGAGGIRASTRSVEALIVGGVGFDTSDAAMWDPPSPKDAEFYLFGSADEASHQPAGPTVTYLAYFSGNVHGLGNGAAVELEGLRVGQVTDVHLDYDPSSDTLRVPVTYQLDLSLLPFRADKNADGKEAPADLVNQAMDRLVKEGLRARLGSANLLTGQRLIQLEFLPDQPPATIDYSAAAPQIPTVASGDLDQLSASASAFTDKLAKLPIAEIGAGLHDIVSHLDQATAGPELGRAVKSLDRSLANLDQITQQASKEVGPALASLRRTADAADQTLEAVQQLVGAGGDRSRDLPALVHELTDAARSLRALADYLDRHPEALLRGRTASAP